MLRGLEKVARPAGLEPATPGLEGRFYPSPAHPGSPRHTPEYDLFIGVFARYLWYRGGVTGCGG
jgi:hypothetical protein